MLFKDLLIKDLLYFSACTVGDSWLIGNGYCNDQSNIEVCGWDGGDCCGDNRNINFCMACECNEGKYIHIKKA